MSAASCEPNTSDSVTAGEETEMQQRSSVALLAIEWSIAGDGHLALAAGHHICLLGVLVGMELL
jgi:hypothetical protein